MMSAIWRNLMTLVRADVDADVAMMTLAMTSVGDLVARGARGSILVETSIGPWRRVKGLMRPILFRRRRLEQDDFDDGGGEVIGVVLKACGSAKQNLWAARGGACSLWRRRGFHEYVDRCKTISVVPSKS